MPAKGTRKIPQKEKAQIIAEKRFKTAKEVASKHGIAHLTVYGIEQKADDELLALADTYEQRIIRKAKGNVDLGLDVIGRRIIDPDEPLAAINASIKLSHEIVRLETGQATQINGSPLESDNFKCQRFIDTVLDIEKNGKRLSLDEAYEVLLSAEMGVEEAIKVRFVEGLRGVKQIG
jgi:hypothetical protein